MQKWPFENAAVIALLAATVHHFDLPLSLQTLGWAVGALALHTARSHAGRLREDAGKPEDWTNAIAGWLAGAAAMLAAPAPQRVLLAVPLLAWVCHTLYRNLYRVRRPVQAPSWSREDD